MAVNLRILAALLPMLLGAGLALADGPGMRGPQPGSSRRQPLGTSVAPDYFGIVRQPSAPCGWGGRARGASHRTADGLPLWSKDG